MIIFTYKGRVPKFDGTANSGRIPDVVTYLSGGTITYLGNDIIMTFTQSGILTVPDDKIISRMLVVGGGGGGNKYGVDALYGAGGGGGGDCWGSNDTSYEFSGVTIPAGTYSVTIGSGGSGAVSTLSPSNGIGNNGGATLLSGIAISLGGGYNNWPYNTTPDIHMDMTVSDGRWGNTSGTHLFGGGNIYSLAPNSTWGSGGSSYQQGSSNGTGGSAYSSDISGSTQYYGAGGGGGKYGTGAGQVGGTGSGSGGSSGGNGGNATAYGAGGGGGGYKSPTSGNGGNGMPGILIIRYTK